MKMMSGKVAVAAALLLAQHVAWAADSVDEAREALQTQEDDVTQEKNLEEVFQAAEKQYSLLPSGQMSLNFSGNYSYYRDDRIDIAIDEDTGNISRFRIEQDAQHSFSSSLSVDYGIWNNLTFNTRLPVSYKYDTEKDVSQAALGDVSFGLRFQPFPVKPGAMNTTLYTTLSTPTGDSPYELNVREEVSSGSGYYSVGAGLSVSKVIDPVVLFGSLGYTYAFDVSGLNQVRGGEILTDVHPGDSLNFSMGLAYSLSYEVSLSASYQQSYNFETDFVFEDYTASSEDSTSSVVNTSLGLRTASNRIVNLSFGFGLTEDSPDVLLGISMPIDFSGLKPGA
ncbi:transporter [Alcanivorax sediminis]|uniref:Transporter n=1 Tax=Alcanivorax sediminis TaxID=2663008 RepID=A0A6N7LUC5_9GAMM|nr:transporter [Alcanivorax sediminis]MQX54069.1 transporter [Alcanivorax sediminis]